MQLDYIKEREILHRVANFILENCSDEEALNIEKNCRENPDWQTIKVCIGRGWEFLQKAAREWNDVDEQYVKSVPDIESVVEQTDQIDEDLQSTENVPVVTRENRRHIEPVGLMENLFRGGNLDLFRWLFWLAG